MSAGNFDRAGKDNNILDRVEKLEGQLKALMRRNIQTERLSNFSGEVGELDFRAVAEDGSLRMIMSAINLLEELGVDGHFAGVDENGVVQFYVSADTGKFTIIGEEFPSITPIEWVSDDDASHLGKMLSFYVVDTASGMYLIGREKSSSHYGVSGLAVEGHDQDTGEYRMLFQVDSKDVGRAFIERVRNDVKHRYFPGGTIFQHVSNVGNVGTGEDVLYSDTLVANAFAAEGDRVCAEYSLNLSAHATATRRVKVKFGGTTIYDSGAVVTAAATRLHIRVNAVRASSSSVVRCTVDVVSNVAAWIGVTYTAVSSLTLTDPQDLVLTGEAAGAGAANDDITARLGVGLFFPGYVA